MSRVISTHFYLYGEVKMKDILNTLMLERSTPSNNWEDVKRQAYAQLEQQYDELRKATPSINTDLAFYDHGDNGDLFLYIPVNQDMRFDEEVRTLHGVIFLFQDLNRSRASVILHWSQYLFLFARNADEYDIHAFLIQPNKPRWLEVNFFQALGHSYEWMLEYEANL